MQNVRKTLLGFHKGESYGFGNLRAAEAEQSIKPIAEVVEEHADVRSERGGSRPQI